MRAQVLARIADHLVALDPGHPLRVAVDGITAAGKSTLAADLTAAVRDRGRPAIHLSADDFHQPRAYRYRQGRDSAAGYYADAYDFAALRRLTLEPLGPAGDRRIRLRHWDLDRDRPFDDAAQPVDRHAVILVDGSFLQRSELADAWDEVIFLDTTFATAQAQGVRRDAQQFGGFAAAEAAYAERYHAACRLYLAEVDPAARASVLVTAAPEGALRLERVGGTSETEVRLFAYGTLQQADVQRSQFGREVFGTPDVLPRHHQDWLQISDPSVIAASGSDRHPLIRPSTDDHDRVPGTALMITAVELAAADRYEVDDYRRSSVILESGVQAWVYLATS